MCNTDNKLSMREGFESGWLMPVNRIDGFYAVSPHCRGGLRLKIQLENGGKVARHLFCLVGFEPGSLVRTSRLGARQWRQLYIRNDDVDIGAKGVRTPPDDEGVDVFIVGIVASRRLWPVFNVEQCAWYSKCLFRIALVGETRRASRRIFNFDAFAMGPNWGHFAMDIIHCSVSYQCCLRAFDWRASSVFHPIIFINWI